MVIRVLALAGGLTGAVGLSQFPEISQQYMQRLGGAVDALAVVVRDFDASASAEGLSRDQALQDMRGSAFLDRRRADMERTFARYDRLRADLDHLRTASPYARALHVRRMTDRDVAQATLEAYVPAVPVSTAGFVFGAVGFLAGYAVVLAMLAGLRLPFRRAKRRAA